MRRITLVLALVLVGCSTYPRASNCPGSTNAPPIVCIDQSLKATPDPVHLHRGQWVHFFFSGSGDIDIEGDFLDNHGHDGQQAWGRVKKDSAYGRHKYTVVNLTTGKRNDPDVMIDPVQ